MRKFAEAIAWPQDGGFAIDAAVDERVAFIRRTYVHLLIEICLVGAVASFVLKTPVLLEKVAMPLASNLIIYLLLFFGVSFVSRKLMEGQKSSVAQYSGAGLWVFFLGVLVSPFAWITHEMTGSYELVGQAFVMTAALFGSLTAYVFISKKDMTFIGGALSILTAIAFGVSLLLAFFGSSAAGSIGYSVVWIALLGGWVLYDTSKIIHHRAINQHVAASVDLLVDFVYMFIHILMLLLRSRN